MEMEENVLSWSAEERLTLAMIVEYEEEVIALELEIDADNQSLVGMLTEQRNKEEHYLVPVFTGQDEHELQERTVMDDLELETSVRVDHFNALNVEIGHSQSRQRAYDLFKTSSWDEKVETGHGQSGQIAVKLLKISSWFKNVNTGHSQPRQRPDDLLKTSSLDKKVETGHGQSGQKVVNLLKISSQFINVNTGHSQLRHRASDLRKISFWDKNIETGHGQIRPIPDKLFKFSFSRDGNVETGHSQLRTRARQVVKEKHQQRQGETAALQQRKRDKDVEPGHSQGKRIASMGFSWEFLLPFLGFLHFKYKHELLNVIKSSVVTSF